MRAEAKEDIDKGRTDPAPRAPSHNERAAAAEGAEATQRVAEQAVLRGHSKDGASRGMQRGAATHWAARRPRAHRLGGAALQIGDYISSDQIRCPRL